MRTSLSSSLILLSLCLGGATLLSVASCSEDEGNEQKPRPVLLRETIPSDSLEFPKDELIPTLSLRFNRPVQFSEVTINIYPEPAQSSELMRSSTGHTLFFNDLKFSTLMDRHYLWIDGPTMPAPEMRIWFDGSGKTAVVLGSVIPSQPNQVREAGAVVYLLPLDTGYVPAEPETFADARPLAIAQLYWDAILLEFSYRFPGLPDNVAYFAVAIVDTNDDGFYDPAADLWGSYGAEPGLPFMESVVSAPAGPLDPPVTPYDFVLQAPVTPTP